MQLENWQQWGFRPETESRYNIERVKGNLPEMESTKQLVKLVSVVYEPGMKVLDVGCNVGHYLAGIRNKIPDAQYTGVDAYEDYINKAREYFKNDKNANFEIRDIFKPIFPESPFDIVYCCNVILHLPDFRKPVINLLNSTKQVCFIRTLLSDKTNIVKSPIDDKYDDMGEPLNFWFLNTWKKEYFGNFIEKLGWNVEFIKDQFSPNPIQKEFEEVKINPFDKGTRIMDGKQVIENVLCNWMWVKITPKE